MIYILSWAYCTTQLRQALLILMIILSLVDLTHTPNLLGWLKLWFIFTLTLRLTSTKRYPSVEFKPFWLPSPFFFFFFFLDSLIEFWFTGEL